MPIQKMEMIGKPALGRVLTNCIRKTKEKRNMNITKYQSLDLISIVLFNKILQTNNYTLLADEQREFTAEENTYLFNLWVKLYDEYYKEKNDSNAKLQLRNVNKRITITSKINQILMVYNGLVLLQGISNELTSNDFVTEKASLLDTLKGIDNKLKINYFDDVTEILKRLEGIIKSYNNELNTLTKVENGKAEKSESKIYKSVIAIQNVLGYDLGDPNKISVLRYLALEQSAKDKIRQTEARNGKKQ